MAKEREDELEKEQKDPRDDEEMEEQKDSEEEEEMEEEKDSEEDDDLEESDSEDEEEEDSEEDEDLDEAARPADSKKLKQSTELSGAEGKASAKGQKQAGSGSAKRKKDKSMKQSADKLDKPKGQDTKEEDEDENKKAFKAVVSKPNFSVKEDVEAVLNLHDGGADLSDDYKSNIKAIFEAAVKDKVEAAVKEVEAQFEEELERRVAEVEAETTETVDKYLNYSVREFMEENKLAIDRGIQLEATQSFLSGLKDLFESHFIEVPEGATNLVEEQAGKIESLEEQLNDALSKLADAHQQSFEAQKREALSKATEDLADSEAEKLNSLAESIEADEIDEFTRRLGSVKKSYFPGKDEVQQTSPQLEDGTVDGGIGETGQDNSVIQAYASAISRDVRR